MAKAKSNFGEVAEGDKKTPTSKCQHNHVGRVLRGQKSKSMSNPQRVYITCSEGGCKVLRKGSETEYRGTDVVYPGRLAAAQALVKESGWPGAKVVVAAAAAAAGAGAGESKDDDRSFHSGPPSGGSEEEDDAPAGAGAGSS
jgi:hypothetical protein